MSPDGRGIAAPWRNSNFSDFAFQFMNWISFGRPLERILYLPSGFECSRIDFFTLDHFGYSKRTWPRFHTVRAICWPNEFICWFCASDRFRTGYGPTMCHSIMSQSINRCVEHWTSYFCRHSSYTFSGRRSKCNFSLIRTKESDPNCLFIPLDFNWNLFNL